MLSTKSIILLPTPRRRAQLMSFWLVISIFSGLVFGVLLSQLVAPRWSGLGLIVALGLALPGYLRPEVASIPYGVWNRLARYYMRGARVLLKGICFYIIFASVAHIGSRLMLTRPSATKSLWVARGTRPASSYCFQYDGKTNRSTQKGWIRTYVSWAVQSGNLWTACLLPFLILLRAVEVEERSVSPTNVYTLF